MIRRLLVVLVVMGLWLGWPATAAQAAPLAASYTVTATIAPVAPLTGTWPTVSATLRNAGKAVSGARLTATWRLLGGAVTCTATSSSSGLARCSRRLTGVKAGTTVTVDLTFRTAKGTWLAAKQLTFREGTGDRDGDHIPDSSDSCPDQARDGQQHHG